MRYPYRKPEDDERPRNFTMVWAPVVKAMVQSGATGREWAVLVALMRFQDRDRLGLLHMGTHQISELTGLSEESVRQALMGLTRRRYLLKDGHEMPILRIIERAARGRPSTYDLCVSREESIDSLKVASPKEAEQLRQSGKVIPRDDGVTPRARKSPPTRDVSRGREVTCDRGVTCSPLHDSFHDRMSPTNRDLSRKEDVGVTKPGPLRDDSPPWRDASVTHQKYESKTL